MEKIIKPILLFWIFFLAINFWSESKVDLIIYSMNRPIQLLALLESIEKNVSGQDQIYIIFKTSKEKYLNAYKLLEKKFRTINFINQNYIPFKKLLLNCMKISSHKYISIIVDDIIVKQKVDLNICINTLEKYKNSFGFFLRLGKNINYCFTLKTDTPSPCIHLIDDILCWQFVEGGIREDGWGNLGDWNFATNVDFTIYRKKEILGMLKKTKFKGVNFESAWWQEFKRDPNNLKKQGLCFAESKVVNICINLSDKKEGNRDQFSIQWLNNKKELSTNSLLKKFNQCLKIDIADISKIINNAPHMEYEVKFINI